MGRAFGAGTSRELTHVMVHRLGSTTSLGAVTAWALLVSSFVACGGGANGAPPAGAKDTGTPERDAGAVPATGDAGAALAIAQSSVQRVPSSAIAPAALTAAVTANNAFAVDLYSRVRSSAVSSNLTTSPLSASFALTMAYAGAAGTTATQMATALHFGAGAASIFDGQNALGQALGARASDALTGDTRNATGESSAAPSPADYQLEVVNSVWGERTYAWEQPFLEVMAKSYGTGIYLEDFITQWDPARLAINAWVSTATDDKINNLLPSGSLDSSTRMVLVNAIHLKLPWETAFKTSATASATFTRPDASTVSANFMNATQTLPYADDGQAQVVGLPLSGGEIEVLIALPHGDLPTYEAGLAAGSAALNVPAESASVTLSLPKAMFTSPTFSLSSALTAMGMVEPFDPSMADFTGLYAHLPPGDHLYIKDVLQKATLGMQETGVEAAAATAVVIELAGSVAQMPMPVNMVVNRPYVVSIVDVPTGAILFLGHVTDPTDAGSP
jgi:serpin B